MRGEQRVEVLELAALALRRGDDVDVVAAARELGARGVHRASRGARCRPTSTRRRGGSRRAARRRRARPRRLAHVEPARRAARSSAPRLPPTVPLAPDRKSSPPAPRRRGAASAARRRPSECAVSTGPFMHARSAGRAAAQPASTRSSRASDGAVPLKTSKRRLACAAAVGGRGTARAGARRRRARRWSSAGGGDVADPPAGGLSRAPATPARRRRARAPRRSGPTRSSALRRTAMFAPHAWSQSRSAAPRSRKVIGGPSRPQVRKRWSSKRAWIGPVRTPTSSGHAAAAREQRGEPARAHLDVVVDEARRARASVACSAGVARGVEARAARRGRRSARRGARRPRASRSSGPSSTTSTSAPAARGLRDDRRQRDVEVARPALGGDDDGGLHGIGGR